MPTKPPELDPATQRQLAAGLFNRVWELLDKADRTPAEDDAMLHAAHASRHHWGSIGTPVNLARGEWQISRVYAVLRRSEPAQHHARRYLAACEAENLGPFDFSFAFEALARASAVAGDVAQRDRFATLAREWCAKAEKAEDREWIERNLQTLAE